MVSRAAVTLLVSFVAIQRFAELVRSRSNERRLRARGAVEHAAWQMPILSLLHAAWLVSIVAEVWLLRPPFRPWLASLALIAFLLGQALRLAAIRTLGERWTVRVLTLPATPRVTRGIYSRLGHPNYIGVALEIASLPLIHGAVVTAFVFSVLNTIVLALRIGVETRALAESEP